MTTLPEQEEPGGQSVRRAGPKPVIGLSGGIGAGKSTVAELLRERGAAVIDSDELNHQVLAEPEVVGTFRKWFGDKALSPQGQIDRRWLASVVFADPAQRQRVEQYLHPRIAERRKAVAARYQADPKVAALVLDSPLLYETHLERECDRVIFVEAEQATRYQRLAASRGWSAEDASQREKVQKGLDFKSAKADYIIRNNSSMDALRRQVDEVFSQIITSVKES